jgi:excisionase family DNA binding protein
MADGDELLTVDEVAGHVKVNPETIRRWIKSGRLPAARPAGGPYRIHSTDVDRLFGVSPKAQAPPEPSRPKALARQSRATHQGSGAHEPRSDTSQPRRKRKGLATLQPTGLNTSMR